MSVKITIPPIQDLYRKYFCEYSTYVIRHRAVPSIEDGLKPSQRRCLLSLHELEDGRPNKLAGLIGNTMKYHPHGDMSIYDTFVTLGQKGWLIDTQGNWGNTITGESPAAPRYIEARLTAFAKEVLFNSKITHWIPTYDGRNQEPITLPVKFPLLLLLGTSGIAVGLSCAILPHNFNELCEACIAAVKGKPFQLYPDFPNGGDADISKYLDGNTKGKIRIRAKIEIRDKNTLAITELPYGIMSTPLMENIVAVTQKGKIKVKSIEDLSGENPEILITLAPNSDPEKTRDALFAFTQCEISSSTTTTVIKEAHPEDRSTTEILKEAVEHTKSLFRWEFEIRMAELEIRYMKLALEKIFIENEIYEKLKSAETFEIGIERITDALKPFFKKLRRKPTDEEILALTEIRLRRIGKYDAAAHQKTLEDVETEEVEVLRKLTFLDKTVIAHFQNLQKKYGKGHERKTKLHPNGFEKIDLVEVDAQNEKVFWNAPEGFVGTGLKKEEPLNFEITPLTDVCCLSRNGTLKVNRVSDKTFFAEDLLDARPISKNGEAPTYHVIYTEKSKGKSYAKSFQIVGGFIREKAYLLAGGSEENQIQFLKVTEPGEEPPKITIKHKPQKRMRQQEVEFDFASIEPKNKEAKGNIVTKHPIASVK